jgi:hypothetical protein
MKKHEVASPTIISIEDDPPCFSHLNSFNHDISRRFVHELVWAIDPGVGCVVGLCCSDYISTVFLVSAQRFKFHLSDYLKD